MATTFFFSPFQTSILCLLTVFEPRQQRPWITSLWTMAFHCRKFERSRFIARCVPVQWKYGLFIEGILHVNALYSQTNHQVIDSRVKDKDIYVYWWSLWETTYVNARDRIQSQIYPKPHDHNQTTKCLSKTTILPTPKCLSSLEIPFKIQISVDWKDLATNNVHMILARWQGNRDQIFVFFLDTMPLKGDGSFLMGRMYSFCFVCPKKLSLLGRNRPSLS